MPNFVRVASTSDLKPGENKVIFVEDEEIALFNVGGEFFAISNVCRHKGGPLGEGMLEDDVVSCPLHGWRYNVRNGSCLTVPNQHVAAYQVKVEGNDVFVSLD